jgi:hypothetical protein
MKDGRMAAIYSKEVIEQFDECLSAITIRVEDAPILIEVFPIAEQEKIKEDLVELLRQGTPEAMETLQNVINEVPEIRAAYLEAVLGATAEVVDQTESILPPAEKEK